MKASKILAGMSALAMAGAMLSIVSFADAPSDITFTSGSWFELDNNDGTDADGKQLKLIQSWGSGATSEFWAGSTELYVTFEVTGFTGNAYLAYQVANKGTSSWDPTDANPAVAIDGDGEYTVSATGISPIENGFNFLAVIFDDDATAKVTNVSTTAPVEDSSSEEDTSSVEDTSSADDSSEADPTPTPVYEEYEVSSEYFNGNTVYLMGEEEKGENGPFNDNAVELAKFKAVKFTVTVDDAALAEAAANGETWLGGGIGFNSESTGWESHEWCFQPYATDDDGNPIDADGDGVPDPIKELTWTKVSDGVYEVTFTRADGGSLFSADDTYAQIWMQDWSGDNAGHITLTGVTLLAEAGEVVDPTPGPVDSDPDDVDSTPEDESSSEADTNLTSSDADTTSTTSTTTTTSTSTTTTTKTDNNPSTGAAALGAVGVLLAGAAMVVSKKNR